MIRRLANFLRRRRLAKQVAEYAFQTIKLERRFLFEHRDIYVAPLELHDRADGPITWTSWAQGVGALLPRADVVGLVDINGRSLTRRWADIEGICGPFVEQHDYEPPRYSPPRWPNRAAWLRLANEHSAEIPAMEGWSGELGD